ncbi:Uncharacterised protein [uncultured archaeon]|nr:Uncharacterised protein [uncultured archaeon]
MIYVEVWKEDLVATIRTEVRNPPGMLFGSTSPLLKPFMKKLEELLPAEKRGRGDSYTLSMLYSHIGSVHGDENLIRIESDEKAVVITREELATMIGDRYPSMDHHRLNLPGLLFLQSSPGFQAAVVSKMKREHDLRFPDGRRTLRYIFHMTVTSIDAYKEGIKIGLDLDRLPKMAGALGAQD